MTALGGVELELLDLPRLSTKAMAPVVADRAYVNIDHFAASYRGEIAVHEVAPWPRD